MNGSTWPYHASNGMKLVLTQPSPWPVHELAHGPADSSRDPAILLSPLEADAGPLGQLIERVIAFDRPAFATPEIVRTSSSKSLLHWPVHVVESTLMAGSQVLERRLTYVYSIFEWWAAVVFRASPAKFEAEVQRAVPILESGRPDWRPGVVALSELFE